MTCTPLTDPLRHLRNRLAVTSGAPSDSLSPNGLDEARRFGWVYSELSTTVNDGSQYQWTLSSCVSTA
jgi:hypothetical protein